MSVGKLPSARRKTSMGPRMVLSSFGRAAPKVASVKSVANE